MGKLNHGKRYAGGSLSIVRGLGTHFAGFGKQPGTPMHPAATAHFKAREAQSAHCATCGRPALYRALTKVAGDITEVGACATHRDALPRRRVS